MARHGRRTRWGLRATRMAATAVAATALTTVVGSAAGAGGADWLEPARDRYEPGQQVTMIGYGYGVVAGYREAVQREGPFHAYLHGPVDDVDEYVGPAPAQGGGLTVPGLRPGVRIGPVTVEEGVSGQMWQGLRVSITFRLPDDLAPGTYWVAMCSKGCRANLGEFADSPVHVGVDPPQPVVRHWPLTDPAIRWLEDGALLMDEHGRVLTAEDVRAGRVPPPPAIVPAPAAEDPPAPEAGRAAAPGTGGDARPAGERRDAGAGARGDADADDPVATVATAGERTAGDAALDPASWAAAVAALVATVAVALWRRRAGRGAGPGPGDGRGGDGGGGTGGGGGGPRRDPHRRIAVRTGDGIPDDAPGGEPAAGPAPEHAAAPDEVLVGASAAGRRPGRRARATL
ncbi:MAG TPA: hypothetical protein VFZ77_23715 [Acidimicrobiales bacterium]